MTTRLIRNFVNDLTEFGGFNHLNIRDTGIRLNNKKFGMYATEIRTKKHDYLAWAYDELGNVFAMDAKGNRTQLIGDKELKVLWV